MIPQLSLFYTMTMAPGWEAAGNQKHGEPSTDQMSFKCPIFPDNATMHLSKKLPHIYFGSIPFLDLNISRN